MNGVITFIIKIIFTITVLAVSGGVCEYLKSKTKTAETQQSINEVYDAVVTAVTATAQTYVDGLKASGNFDVVAQTTAKNNAINLAISMISATAQKYIADNYGNIKDYIATKVEEVVKNQKEGKTA